MTTFCQTLFTMTAAATAAALAVMILRLLLKKAPRWITCALWLVVFLRMVCPVSLDLPVSLMPASITSGAAAERVIPTTITPTVPETTPAQSAPAAAEEAEPAAAAPAANPEPVSPGLDRNDFLFAVWVMGAAGMALWGAVSYLRLRRRISEAVRLEGNLYETDQIDTPFVCGFFRPRIYLPVNLDPTDRKYVVLHEQAHIRRLDHLTKPLAYLALCVHWFNPVLWLAFRLFCRDVETACDQAVIRNLDREKTAGYAAALLHLGRKTALPQAVPLAFGEENAKKRIKGVLRYKKTAGLLVAAAVILCVVVGVLLLGSSTYRLEGHTVTDSCTWACKDPVHFPEDLQQEAIRLLKPYLLTKKEIPAPEVSPYGNDGVTLIECQNTSPRRSYAIYESAEGICLLYTESSGDIFTRKNYLLDDSFQADYDAWMEKVNEYLWVTRPDALYGRRGPLESQKDAEAILDCLHFWELMGNYNIQLDTSTDPCQVSIQLQRIPGLRSQQEDLQEYLRLVSLAFQSLATNAAPITWDRENPLGDWEMVPSYEGSAQTKEEFRQLYAQLEQASAFLRPLDMSSYYKPAAVLYLSPALPGADSQEDLPVLYQYSLYTIHAHSFMADLMTAEQTLAEDHYADDPLYDCRALPDGVFPAEAGLDLSQYQSRYYTIVNDSQGQDTGYRLYQLDQDLFLAHYTTSGTLEYLFQITSDFP